MSTEPVVIPFTMQRMICTGCGAEANASCTCGVAYVPAAKRVADYDKANPGRSTRQAAADLGTTSNTVSKARRSGATQVAPDTVTGRDGKRYQAKRMPKQVMPTEEEAEEEYQLTIYDQACRFLEEMTGETRQRFFAHIRRKYHV